MKYAEIAQLVEHNLAKVGVASSSLVFRSKTMNDSNLAVVFVLCFAGDMLATSDPKLPPVWGLGGVSKISESLDIWRITILREPQRRVKFSTNFAVGIARIRVHTQWALTICLREKRKSFGFFSFLFVHCQKLSKMWGYFVAYKINFSL